MKQLTKDYSPKYTSSSCNSTAEKQTTQSKSMQKTQTDISPYRDIQVVNKDMKRSSTQFIIREMQIKTTFRYRLTVVRMAIIKKSTNNTCWRGYRQKGSLLHCWGQCKLMQPLQRTVCAMLSHSAMSHSLCLQSTVSRAVACQDLLSMGFSRQEYWSGLPCPPPGDLPNLGMDPGLPHCRWILYCLSHQGSPEDSMAIP